MISFPLANSSASKITVTTAATPLLTLINTAGSTTHNFLLNLDAADIVVESGSVRVLYDGNTPTASNGVLLSSGTTFVLRHVPLKNVVLISTSGSVSCSVQIGESEASETTVLAGSSGGTGSSASQVQGNIASLATDSGNPVKTGGVYNSTAPTATNGQRVDTQMDVNGNTQVNLYTAIRGENATSDVMMISPKVISESTNAVSVDKSAALEASTVTKASAGRLYAATVRVDSTLGSGTYYIQFLNAASLPADGAVTTLTAPQKVIHTNGTDDNISFDWSNVGGIYASTGIVMCLSSTEYTKTISTAHTSSTLYYA